jgi:hypothetical protein
MKLSSDQIETIRKIVVAGNIRIDTLREDIIDHLCCAIESEDEGKEFEELLENAITELAPEGLTQLQRQTVFLLNSKRIIFMKKLMYFIGFIGSVALTAGVTFKLLHMPGADELFIMGFLTLLLLFVPLSAIDRYKVILARAISEKAKVLTGVLSALLAGTSAVFKLMHLPGADELLIAAAFVFGLGFLPFFFFTMYKRSLA